MVVGIAQEIILQPINTPSQKKKKMVVGIAQEIILQPINTPSQKKKNGSWNSTRNNFTTNQIKIFLSVQNKNSENFENLEITPKAKFIIEGIYKAFFEHKCIT